MQIETTPCFNKKVTYLYVYIKITQKLGSSPIPPPRMLARTESGLPY